MIQTISRRKALTAGAVSTGALLGTSCSSDKPGIKKSSGSSYRYPGRDENLVRDLTPGSTSVRLAAFDHRITYPENGSITEMVGNIRKAGYTSAGSHTSIGTKNPWLTARDSVIKELHDALESFDVTVFDVMVWTNLIHPDSNTRQNNLRYVTENIEAAERLGCPMVTMVTGSCDPDYYIASHPDNWSDTTWKLTLRSIGQLLDDTAGMNASLGIEAVVTTNIDSPAAHKQLMDDIGDPRCKVCLDPTNMLSLPTFYHTTELLDDCFDTLGENILGCHAKDDIIERDRMLLHITEVPAGMGIMDYETYLVRLSRMKWPRTLLIEHIKPEEYPVAKAFIENTAANVGVRIYG